MAARGFKIVPGGLKMPQDVSRWFQNAPKRPQDGSKVGPKMLKDTATGAGSCSYMALVQAVVLSLTLMFINRYRYMCRYMYRNMYN